MLTTAAKETAPPRLPQAHTPAARRQMSDGETAGNGKQQAGKHSAGAARLRRRATRNPARAARALHALTRTRSGKASVFTAALRRRSRYDMRPRKRRNARAVQMERRTMKYDKSTKGNIAETARRQAAVNSFIPAPNMRATINAPAALRSRTQRDERSGQNKPPEREEKRLLRTLCTPKPQRNSEYRRHGNVHAYVRLIAAPKTLRYAILNHARMPKNQQSQRRESGLVKGGGMPPWQMKPAAYNREATNGRKERATVYVVAANAPNRQPCCPK